MSSKFRYFSPGAPIPGLRLFDWSAAKIRNAGTEDRPLLIACDVYRYLGVPRSTGEFLWGEMGDHERGSILSRHRGKDAILPALTITGLKRFIWNMVYECSIRHPIAVEYCNFVDGLNEELPPAVVATFGSFLQTSNGAEVTDTVLSFAEICRRSPTPDPIAVDRVKLLHAQMLRRVVYDQFDLLANITGLTIFDVEEARDIAALAIACGHPFGEIWSREEFITIYMQFGPICAI